MRFGHINNENSNQRGDMFYLMTLIMLLVFSGLRWWHIHALNQLQKLNETESERAPQDRGLKWWWLHNRF